MVADWLRAEIDYTQTASISSSLLLRIGCGLRSITLDNDVVRARFVVADWLRAEIDYTCGRLDGADRGVADWLRAEIDYTA